MAQPLIELRDLKKVYPVPGGEVVALGGVSLKIDKGEIYGIIGMSGAGKSTLIRCINRLDTPTDGQILIDGENILALRGKELIRMRRRVSMIFQQFNLLMQKTVARNVRYPLELAGVPVFRDAFERAIASGVPTVYLSFSSGLSGSFDAAALVHDQLMAEHPDAELYIVDTCLASVAEALLVYEALRQRDNGMTAQELARWAEEARYFVDAEFMVDDLEALRRGGRIPSSVAYAGSKLDVKPLLTITVDGKLSLAGVARGRKKGIKQLAEYYNKRKADSRPGRCVVIGNADCPKDAARLQEALGKGDDSILFLESSIGPVIGSHVGPDMIAVVFWGNDKREELSVADRIAKKVKGGE